MTDATAALEVSLLGPLEVRRDGELLPPPPPRQRVLLTRLALSAGRAVPVDTLLEALWGEHLPADPANALQWQVGQLRRALGADAIATRGAAYELDLDPLRIDVTRVQADAAAGAALRRLGDHAAAAATAEAALALWRGEPLSDARELDFAQAWIAQLEDTHVALTQLRLASQLELGQPDAAVAELQGLTRRFPDREELWRLLMLGLYRAGRQADALEAYRSARQRLDETAGLEPSAALRELHTAILNQDPSLDADAATAPQDAAGVRSRRPLPTPPTDLLGREADVAAIAERLRGRARVVTVTGLGGVGKTRLALAVAHELADGFADGAVFVPLQGLDDQELVAPAIAAALDLDLGDERIETTLLRAVAPLELLLVVDNVEHLLSCVPLLEDLVAAAPRLRLLATSRFSLRMSGEHEHRLDPLAFAATSDAAVELFAQCAHAAGVDLDGADRDAARELCARLDGLPLAIELAAARLRLLGVDDLLAAMTTEAALADGADDAYGQRTLSATINGTWQLLSDAERDAFARLAVFPGSFDSAAAIAVLGGAPDTLGIVASLFDRSLLRRTRIGRQVRLSMLATLRAYALDRLDEQGEFAADHARRVHAEHYTERLQASIPAGQAVPFREAEAANLRVALDYAVTRSDRDLLARLAPAMRIAWAGASSSFVAVLSGVARLPELAAAEPGPAGPGATA